jgi:hypothetical protein
MFEITNGGLCGHIGSFVWFNGADTHPDDYTNSLTTCVSRFGSIQWWPSHFWVGKTPIPLIRFRFY